MIHVNGIYGFAWYQMHLLRVYPYFTHQYFAACLNPTFAQYSCSSPLSIAAPYEAAMFFINYETITLCLVVFICSFLLFYFPRRRLSKGLIRAIQITSGAVLPLGIEILIFDSKEFTIQVASAVPFLTNEDFLFLTAIVFGYSVGLRYLSKRQILISVAVIAMLLNIATFIQAYPRIFNPIPSSIEWPFSAYYNGAWRFVFDPSHLYYGGNDTTALNSPQMTVTPQTFRYLPSFLIFALPLLAFSYQNAFIIFDIAQMCLLPLLAYFVFKLVQNRNVVIASFVLVIALLDPLFPFFTAPDQFGTAYYGFSFSYFWSWTEGEAHVLLLILIIGSLYFASINKTSVGALLLALGSFDPRFAVLALPLVILYNRKDIWSFLGYYAFFLLVTNGFFFYSTLWGQFEYSTFFYNIVGAGAASASVFNLYPYEWIPLYGILAISIIEFAPIVLRNVVPRIPHSTRLQKLFGLEGLPIQTKGEPSS